ncbi:MAG: isochorismatase family protein [Planctomycetaceae bacterium]
MKNSILMERNSSCLIVIDLQQKLIPAIPAVPGILNATETLLSAASLMNIPRIVTQQYPKGLGATVDVIQEAAVGAEYVDKVEFSGANAVSGLPSIHGHSSEFQFILCGIETHICVLQTAIELRTKGSIVFVVADATASRNEADHAMALQRMRSAGCIVTTTESVVFEWCRTAAASEFKSVSRLIRNFDERRKEFNQLKS